MANATERAKGEATRFALSMLKRPKLQDGGAVTGPLMGYGGGRSDTLPISVPAGSYVVPADIVSGLPGAQGNSLAGHNALTKMFNALPLSPDEGPYGAGETQLPRGHTIPGLYSQHHLATGAVGPSGLVAPYEGPDQQQPLAGGGSAKSSNEGETVPILAAAGEFVVKPEFVKRLGMGNLKRGHDILDRWVKETREKHIKTLKKLPGPVKN